MRIVQLESRPWQRWAAPSPHPPAPNLAECDQKLHNLRRGIESWSGSTIDSEPFLETLELVDQITTGRRIPDETLRPLFHLLGALQDRHERPEPGLRWREEPAVREAMIEGLQSKLESWLETGRIDIRGEQDLLALSRQGVPIRNGVIDGQTRPPTLSVAAESLLDRLESFWLDRLESFRALEELRGQPELAGELVSEIVEMVTANPQERTVEKVAKVLELAAQEPALREILGHLQPSLFGLFEELEARSLELSRDGYVSGRYGRALLELFPDRAEEFVENTLTDWLNSPSQPRRQAARLWCGALAQHPVLAPKVVEAVKRSPHYDSFLALEAFKKGGGEFSLEDLRWMAEQLADPDGPRPEDNSVGRFYFECLLPQAREVLTGSGLSDGFALKILKDSAHSYEVVTKAMGSPLLSFLQEEVPRSTFLGWLKEGIESGRVSDSHYGWKALPFLLKEEKVETDLVSLLEPVLEQAPAGKLGSDLSKVRLAYLEDPPSGTPTRTLFRTAQLEKDSAAEVHLQALAQRDDWNLEELEQRVKQDLVQGAHLTREGLVSAEVLWRRGHRQLLPDLVATLPALTVHRDIGEFRLREAVRQAYGEQLEGRLREADGAQQVVDISQEWRERVNLWEQREAWADQAGEKLSQLGCPRFASLLEAQDRWMKPEVFWFLAANNLGPEALDQSADLLSYALEQVEDAREAGKVYQGWLDQVRRGTPPDQIKELFLRQQLGLEEELEVLNFEIEPDSIVIGDVTLDRLSA